MPRDTASPPSTRSNSTRSSSASVDTSTTYTPQNTNNSNTNNGVSDNIDPESLNNDKIDSLLRQRNNDLIELYCVSRLHELLNINDQTKLNDELTDFLSQNDFNKNGPFSIESIPNFKQSIPITSASTNSSNNSSSSSLSNESVTNQSAIANEKKFKTLPQHKSTGTFKPFKDQNTVSAPGTGNNLKRSINEVSNDNVVKDKHESDHKKLKANDDLDSQSITEVNKTKVISSDINISNDNTDHANKEISERVRQRSMYLMSGSSHLQPSNSLNRGLPREYTSISSIKAEPTPVNTTSKDSSNSLITELRAKISESVDYYNKNNINSKETIYLLMKENVPSKVAQALPLAELKYLAHTLPLVKLLPMAHKALTTEIINNALNEGRITVVASRIEELRRLGLWSLRQPKKFLDPYAEELSHHKILMAEAKWMQQNFKEDQKFKYASCASIAQAIADYWAYGDVCCIKTKPIKFLPEASVTNSISIATKNEDDINETVQYDTSEVLSAENSRPDKLNNSTPVDVTEPNISGNLEDVTLLSKLPIDTSFNTVESFNTNVKTRDELTNLENSLPNEIPSTSLDPINQKPETVLRESELTQTELVFHDKDVVQNQNEIFKDDGLESEQKNILVDPKTLSPTPDLTNIEDKVDKSTADLANEQDDPSNSYFKSSIPFKIHLTDDEFSAIEQTIMKEAPKFNGILEFSDELPESLDFIQLSKSLVSLDDDGFLKLVERQLVDEEQSLVQLSKRRGIFYGNRRSHYLKPPTAPSLRYLTSRTPTIWLPEDDEELVKNINAYAYNWELIAAHMLPRPMGSYISNIERRTPWQCFERFVQLNEKFNFNDLKGPKAHLAQQWLIEAHKFQQKQNRRISPLGVGAESIQRGHKRLRWASMFDAVRKCIKKRENSPRPNPTQQRKPLDVKNMKVPTPAEMSNLKSQRDEALRRDIQMRRNVKSRLQQQQQIQKHALSQPPSSNGSSVNGFSKPQSQGASGSSLNSGIGAPDVKKYNDQQNMSSSNQSSQSPIQKQYTEKEIIETYAKKIIQQKPEISPEMAIRAAQNYLKNFKQQQSRMQQAHQIQKQRLQTDQINQISTSPQAHSNNINNNNNITGMPINNTASSLSTPDPSMSANTQGSKLPFNKKSSTLSSTTNLPVNNINIQNSSSGGNTMRSPTPQEILKRLQK